MASVRAAGSTRHLLASVGLRTQRRIVQRDRLALERRLRTLVTIARGADSLGRDLPRGSRDARWALLTLASVCDHVGHELGSTGNPIAASIPQQVVHTLYGIALQTRSQRRIHSSWTIEETVLSSELAKGLLAVGGPVDHAVDPRAGDRPRPLLEAP